MTQAQKRFAIVAAVLAVLGAGAAMKLAPSFYEVVDKGHHIRPYDSGEIYEIRIAERVTVYASEESRPNMDVVSGSALVALATAAFMTCLLLLLSGERRRLVQFYAFAAGGLAFLSADEFLAIHETVGHNLLFLSDIPGIERPDDVIISLYLIPAGAFLYVFRDVIRSSPKAVRLFGAGLVLFALAGLADITGTSLDEVLEILVAACVLGGFVLLMAGHLSARFQLSPPTGSPTPVA
jgi:hypothetical protein